MQKPLTGALLGVLVGVSTAIFLARQGIWPIDQLTLFFLPGILGLLGVLLLSMDRRERTQATLVIALLILVPMLVWGAFGFGSFGETGELNGGCTVSASSDDDSTTVTDTSRDDPFTIDPNGGLTWEASSPTVFQDYDWRIWVDIGGIPIPLDSDRESNENGDQENGGSVPNVGAYADSIGIDLDIYRGVYKVGGSASTCDGFGFVRILGDGSDPLAILALVLAISLLIVLLALTFAGRGDESATEDEEVVVIEETTTSTEESAEGMGDTGADTESG